MSIGTIWKLTGTAWLMFASHKTVLNTQNLNVGWLGCLDLSQNITPPRAPCGAINVDNIFIVHQTLFCSYNIINACKVDFALEIGGPVLTS